MTHSRLLYSEIGLLLLIFIITAVNGYNCTSCNCNEQETCPVSVEFNDVYIFTSNETCNDNCSVTVIIETESISTFDGIITTLMEMNQQNMTFIIKLLSDDSGNAITSGYFSTYFNIVNLKERSDRISVKFRCKQEEGCIMVYTILISEA